MLRELHIKNVAVIEDVTINFYDGFHVLTGETGAGKSILIDSINMALGQRTSKDLIRTGAESATVDIVFEPSENVKNKLAEFDVETDDGMLYITRSITRDGKSKSRINGHPVPSNMIKDLSVYLLTIHGQHDNQSLLFPKYHIEFVDNYGNYSDLLNEYKNQYCLVKDIENSLNKLISDESGRAHRIDLLKYQINEISSASICVGEKEELEKKREYAANIEKIANECNEAYVFLYGDNEQLTAYDAVSSALSCLERIADYDSKLNELYSTISSVLADMEDVARELRSYTDNADYNPGELDKIEDRLETILSLERKYGGGEQEILNYLDNAIEELNGIENSDEEMKRLQNILSIEKEKLCYLAQNLSEKRKEAGLSLQNKIMDELTELDMNKMRFLVSVTSVNDENGFKYMPLGIDKVEFLISTNPGEGLKPLSKIASGGEMSRIMLAMKSVLTDSDIVDTLIFDEIDTGVSGRAAQKIAEKIRALSKKRQILCITHLAQLAGMANVHYLVNKVSDETRTHTSVLLLDNEERKYELARIIGGVKITDLTLRTAQEMLDMADIGEK